MSPAQRGAHLGAFDTGTGQLAWAQSRTDTAIGINYHRPTDTARMSVTARKDGSDYVLDGTAHAVANAPLASLLAVSATTDPTAPGIAGVVTLLVPAGAAGMSIVQARNDTAFMRGHGAIGDVVFRGCRVPEASLLPADAVRVAYARYHLLAACCRRQSRHRSRRLRERARLREIARAGRPADHRAPGDRREARRCRDLDRGARGT